MVANLGWNTIITLLLCHIWPAVAIFAWWMHMSRGLYTSDVRIKFQRNSIDPCQAAFKSRSFSDSNVQPFYAQTNTRCHIGTISPITKVGSATHYASCVPINVSASLKHQWIVMIHSLSHWLECLAFKHKISPTSTQNVGTSGLIPSPGRSQ
jgi:hypothetical protein